MKSIVLIEDSPEDTSLVKMLLESLRDQISFSLTCISSLSEAKTYFLSHYPDLVLLDLEFTNENRTSLSFLSDVLFVMPVIVLSHLSHYQNSLIQHVNVKAFINKDHLNAYLCPAILKVLSPDLALEPKVITFPSPNIHGIPESVSIDQIMFIEKVGRREYHIHLTNNTIQSLSSISFSDLCVSMRKQNITLLQPVSRNEIINITCIQKIYRQEKGRLNLTLINLPMRPFHVGKSYEDFFLEHFSVAKR